MLFDARGGSETTGRRFEWGKLMGDWQPIETAPRDRWILVWGPDSNVRDAAWCNVPGKFTGWVESLKEPLPIKPTHWMPLPAPPTIGDRHG